MSRSKPSPGLGARVAVVDVGSNSTRLLIADIGPGGAIFERLRHSRVTRLAEGVDADRRLKPEAIARVCATLDEYAALIAGARATAATAVFTSAVRDSTNGPSFVADVADRYQIDPRLLHGDEEARLTFLGATSARDPGHRAPTLVIDIGGGSTELILGSGRHAAFNVSLQAGVVRHAERHFHSDPPTPAELRALRTDVRQLIDLGVPPSERRTPAAAIAVAGTATSCAAIDQGLHRYDPARIHGYMVDLSTCRLLLARLASLTLAERRAVRGLHPDRAPTIVAGVAMLIEVLEAFDLPGFETSEHDILRGAALELAGFRPGQPRPATPIGADRASRP